MKKLYREDRRTVTLFSGFTVLALLISAFGLFGFSVFDMQQRYREIALRKVNGATLGEILVQLMRHFLGLVWGSFLLACPLAVWIIQKYTGHFSLHAPLSVWLFVIAMLITLGVTLLTLIGQSYRAASENPVKALKND
ncbi:MAG: ABC transporter permease [Odoribacter splanchnicus]